MLLLWKSKLSYLKVPNKNKYEVANCWVMGRVNERLQYTQEYWKFTTVWVGRYRSLG